MCVCENNDQQKKNTKKNSSKIIFLSDAHIVVVEYQITHHHL